MTNLTETTLRPGLLVSLKTSVVGNAVYSKEDIEPDHVTLGGERKARWETTRVINDPAEHELATKVRSQAGQLIRRICAKTSFGLLCPQDDAWKLDSAILEAREMAAQFNKSAKLTKVYVYIVTGRVADNDVEAVRAINSEVRGLMEDMQEGIKNCDPAVIREAANRARNLGSMLSKDAQERVKQAIETARAVARQIVKAGETAAQVVDNQAILKISTMRTAFLDLDDTATHEPVTVVEEGRAVDFDVAPVVEQPAAVPTPERQIEIFQELRDLGAPPALVDAAEKSAAVPQFEME